MTTKLIGLTVLAAMYFAGYPIASIAIAALVGGGAYMMGSSLAALAYARIR